MPHLTDQSELRQEFHLLGIEVLIPGFTGSLMSLQIQSDIVERIKAAQLGDPKIQRLRDQVSAGLRIDLVIHEDGSLRFGSRVCVPAGDIRTELLAEAHSSPYSIHPGGTKMYKGLRLNFWWPGMKIVVAKSVSECSICQQVKIDHQRVAGLLQPLPIPQWKWQHLTMDFVTGLPPTPRKNDAVWVVVDRLTKSARFIPFRVGQSTEVLAQKYMRV